MTRTTSTSAQDFGLKDDELYQGVLVSAAFVKSKKPDYPDQILCKWELRQGAVLFDYVGISLGITAGTKQPSRLRQLLNALAEKDKSAELWFDPATLEWGYDLDGDDSTPAYAVLTPGMLVMFKGENRKGNDGVTRYKVTGYKQPTTRKPKQRPSPTPDPEVVDVDPAEIPF